QFETFVYDTDEIKAVANLQASYKIANDWTVGTQFGMDFTETHFLQHRSPDNWTELYFQTRDNEGNITEEYLGTQTENMIRSAMFTTTSRLNYNKTFAEKHTLDASVFFEYTKAHRKAMQYTQNGLD